jgi:membrane protein DedA with SNARE-associated domain
LVLAAVIGPAAWVVAWLVAVYLLEKTDAIEVGLLITVAAFVMAFPVLGLLAWGRRREERRYLRATPTSTPRRRAAGPASPC